MTVVCLASGPSLTVPEAEYARGKADRFIAVNDTYRLAPWADLLYAADREWWDRHAGLPTFRGRKATIEPINRAWPGVEVFRNMGTDGLETTPGGLRTGLHSGYQAINVAVHEGASRIVLLGYDMQPAEDGSHHHHAAHPGDVHPSYGRHLPLYHTLVAPLAALGIEIVNCSRRTAITAFRRASIWETLR